MEPWKRHSYLKIFTYSRVTLLPYIYYFNTLMLPKSDTWKKETHIAWEPNWRKIYGYMNGGIETIPHEGFGWTIKNKDMKVRVCHMFEKIEFFSQQSERALKKIMEQIATKWDWKGHEISRICVQYLCYIKLTWQMGLFPSLVGTKLCPFRCISTSFYMRTNSLCVCFSQNP